MIVVMMMMMMLVVVVSAISLSRPSHSMSTNCFVCLLSSWMHFDYNKEMPQKYLDPWHINFFCLSSSTVFTDEMARAYECFRVKKCHKFFTRTHLFDVAQRR